MNDPTLFDPARTTEAVCVVCGATRQPDEERAPACTFERDRDTVGHTGRRPRNCLNAYDPAHADIGF